ncbi:MAG TPA: hypothetical protein PLH56_02800 [Candidatus Omnitrophota bacterium]|nr:hypothetical protein [Candidatus Omnitrophota bacterium]HPN88246.1 hypothetical protein [Candidatus Omnitrophota bacterium]
MNIVKVYLILFLCFCFGCASEDPLNPSRKKDKSSSSSVILIEEKESSINNNVQENFSFEQHEQGIIPQATFKPFYVYKEKTSFENHYIPSGFMPDGKCLSLQDGWMLNCHSGETCIKIIYDIACSNNDQRWSGIYWLNPPNNWGNRKGGFNLTGAQKLVFWAKGEKGGEQIEEFIVGGIMGDFSDSAKITMGPVILTNEWREYTIDLRGRNLSYISGGFGWATNTRVNPETCIFYLDDIRFE